MTGINVVFRPLCFGDPEMALLEAALSANVTIKFIALVLAVELRPGEAQTLGNILRTHTTVETLIVRGAPNDQLQRLWSGVFSNTTSLKTINLHGLSASAVSTLAHARTDHSSLITNFGFVECTFSAEAVEDLLTTQFNPPFQRNGKSHRLIVHECIFETVEEKRRFARALARTTSWQSFVFEDEKRLDKETAAMFAQAIAANHALEEVGFIVWEMRVAES
ncbi:unknown protein [Seminavis robusta]|uniref:Uncharacterized protein n=1 Tax=Seminavis robusta TaxID=568900 RepID=A0A9N8HRJ5_9STRA|nr:unknown protein [Seminavis robusta]|eukprot:Sro1329_g263270.1 n/a (221) ;mRNA; f:1482-2144